MGTIVVGSKGSRVDRPGPAMPDIIRRPVIFGKSLRNGIFHDYISYNSDQKGGGVK